MFIAHAATMFRGSISQSYAFSLDLWMAPKFYSI